jgi:predicted RND superfamily exporter protein
MIGFFALTLSIFPVLSDLGFTLGIGIMLILLSTFISIPVLVIIEEKIAHEKAMKKKKKEPFYLKIFESYGSLVSRRPYLTILLALIITALFFTGISRINNEEIDFDNTLPQDLPELVAFQTVTNEFGNPTSVNLYVSLDPSLSNSMNLQTSVIQE